MKPTWREHRSTAIGAAVCSVIAFLFAPEFWWLGLFAGTAIGSISSAPTYDFRKTREAFVRIWQEAKQEGVIWLADKKRWLKEPHQFIYPAIVLVIFIMTSVYERTSNSFLAVNHFMYYLVFMWVIGIFLATVFVPVIAWFLVELATIGANSEGHYCKIMLWTKVMNKKWELMCSCCHTNRIKWESKVYTEVNLTYFNALYWIMAGLLYILKLCVWTWWTQILLFLSRLSKVFVRKLYSKQMSLCAFFGPLW